MKLVHPRLPVFLAGVVAGVIVTFGGLHAAMTHGRAAAWISAKAFLGAMIAWCLALNLKVPK